jgi:hypothetical protein
MKMMIAGIFFPAIILDLYRVFNGYGKANI